jgi:hypothetical protein
VVGAGPARALPCRPGLGDYRRADSLLTAAIAEARRIGDRGGEIDALIGFSNTRSATGGLEAALSVLDSLEALLPPGDRWERVSYLCRLGLFRAILSDSGAPRLTGQGIAMAVRLGERRLTGHCFEAHAMAYSLLGRGDSVLAIMDRAEVLLSATHDHASLARLASPTCSLVSLARHSRIRTSCMTSSRPLSSSR